MNAEFSADPQQLDGLQDDCSTGGEEFGLEKREGRCFSPAEPLRFYYVRK